MALGGGEAVAALDAALPAAAPDSAANAGPKRVFILPIRTQITSAMTSMCMLPSRRLTLARRPVRML